MKEVKTNVMRILDKAEIPYVPHYYDCSDGVIDGLSVAAKMGQNPESVYKTLVTRGASGSFFVFVVPVAAGLHLKAAARAVGEKSVAMIHVNEINGVTGYIRGGCSPIGMKKQFCTVLDQTVEKIPAMIVSGGKKGTQVELAPQELAKLAGAKIAAVADWEAGE